MNKTKATVGLSVGIIMGCIAGVSISVLRVVIPNDYIHYKMHWLIAFSLRKELNQWIFISVILVIALNLLYYISRFIGNLLFSEFLEIEIKDSLRLTSRIIGLVTGFLFFLGGGWAINHYLLPQMFHPLSLLGDLGILLASLFMGWAISGIKWDRLVPFLKSISIVFSLLIILLNVAIEIRAKTQASQEPNILLISVETLRPDHLGCYGYARDTSPNLDSFAKEGLLFKTCFSQSASTAPSCSSIMSGFFPHETRVTDNVTTTLPLKLNTLAEILRNNGYATVAVVSNYILRKSRGFEQGFDIYDDELEDKEVVRRVPERIAARTTDRAIEYLKKHRNRKLFLWVHYQDPHGPYTPPPPFDTQFRTPGERSFDLKANDSLSGDGGIPSYQRLGQSRDYEFYVSQYDGEIRYFDHHFGRFLGAVKESGLYDDSFMVLTADHGEGMGEHDFYFAHEQYVYNTLIHVPLIIKPAQGHPGIRENYVQHIDLAPTILKWTGLSTPWPWRGRDLLGDAPADQEIFSEQGDKSSIILDRMKYVHHALKGQYFLYDLASDFYEEHDLIQEAGRPDLIQKLGDKLEHYRQENRLAAIRPRRSAVSPKDLEKLKSLGYVH